MKAHQPFDGPSEPFTPAMIAGHLRAMPTERLEMIKPAAFQMWPVRKIVPGQVIRELIANERSRRARRL